MRFAANTLDTPLIDEHGQSINLLIGTIAKTWIARLFVKYSFSMSNYNCPRVFSSKFGIPKRKK